MKKFFQVLAVLLGLLSAGAASLLFLKVDRPKRGAIWLPKLLAGSLAPITGLLGAIGAGMGFTLRNPLAILAGGFGSIVAARYLSRAVAGHDAFSRAFGPGWQAELEQKLTPQQRQAMLSSRWQWRMSRPPEPRWQRDVCYLTIPAKISGTGAPRDLYCDIWEPPASVPPTGLAFLYFHGSAWHLGDKDFGTRPFFRHLAAQGHVVMDVAYRLCPEVDYKGMQADVRRAVAWMKENAAQYGINPQRIVIGGASAGGHISLLVAYTPALPELIPSDLRGKDVTVRGVISYYGPTDLRASFASFGVIMPTEAPSLSASAEKPGLATRAIGAAMKAVLGESYDTLMREGQKLALMTTRRMMDNLLGGSPGQVPSAWELASPITYAGAGCPPTLLIQGEDDFITPINETRRLYGKLAANQVPAVLVTFPQTDHGFDLFLPEVSPVAQSALYDVDRFLAMLM
jgi:acetyl esterase/lipase